MCILLYVKLIWCILDESGTAEKKVEILFSHDKFSAVPDSSNMYLNKDSNLISKLIGVMVFHRHIVNWSVGVDVSSVYVYSAICETYLV